MMAAAQTDRNNDICMRRRKMRGGLEKLGNLQAVRELGMGGEKKKTAGRSASRPLKHG